MTGAYISYRVEQDNFYTNFSNKKDAKELFLKLSNEKNNIKTVKLIEIKTVETELMCCKKK